MTAVFERLRAAITAVCAAQADDGGWEDFQIAGMGASGPWVTAAIGLRLAELPPALTTAAVTAAVDRALGYLEAAEAWSYNHKAPADADTIAHALLLYAARGRRRDQAVDDLLGFQTADGGFSTFTPRARGASFASWTISHPDVTPVAARDTLADAVRAGELDGPAVDAALAVVELDALPPRQWPAGLTDREIEVLSLMSRGAADKQIAADLGITAKTVAHHVQHLYDKIGVRSRAGATLFAVEHGLLR